VHSQSAPIDINAQLYINRAGIQSDTEKDAINKFVRALKYYNIWDNIHALYIPTGGTELSHKLNLKDPRDADDAYRLYYPNGAEHSNYGTSWNGIDQGALTFYSPTTTRLHFMVYQDQPATAPYIFSGDRNGNTDYNSYTWSAFFTNGGIGFANQGNYNYEPLPEQTGFFYGQRFHNDSTEGFVNGSLIAKWFQPFNPWYNTDTSQKIWINKSSSLPVFSGTARYQVLSIGNTMDSSDVRKYYEIVQAFLTELGIQSGDPLGWPEVPDDFTSDYTNSFRWIKANETAVDTAIDGAHLYSINDSLYLWGGWNGSWFPFDFNTGYVSGDGGHNWNRIGQAPWNKRHSAAYGTDSSGNAFLVGSDMMPASTNEDRKEVWKTTDGRNWELQTGDAPWSENLILHGLAIKGDTLYIAGGQFGPTVTSGLNDTIWRSTDGGIHWTIINTNANHLGGILYNNFKYFSARNKFVAFCGGIYDNFPGLRVFSSQVWTSEDCITWTRENDIPFSPRHYSDMVEWDGKLWVWAGDRPAQTGSGFLNLNDLWYMDKDGKWHQVGDIPVPERHATAVAVDKKNNRLVFACGNMHTDVWYLEKYPLHNDQVVMLDSNCSFIVPNCIDSLQNDFGAHVSFVQTPVAGSVLHYSPGQTFPIKIFADYGNGNTQTSNFYFIPKDTSKPRIDTPANRIVYIRDSCSILIPDLLEGLTVQDCNNVTVHQSINAGTRMISSDGQVYTIVITATDAEGNSSSCTVLITAKDTTAPVFDPLQAIVVQNTPGRCDATVNVPLPVAYDNCTNVIFSAERSDSLSLNAAFPGGITTITWKAQDLNGNISTALQTVEVLDTEAPVIILSPSSDPGCNPSSTAIHNAFGIPTVSDNCSIGIQATFTDDPEVNVSGCLYAVTRTWTATDHSGNTATVSQVVTFSRDTEAPVITISPSSDPGCNPDATAISNAFGTATVNDNCSTGLTAIFSDEQEEYVSGCTYSVKRNWMAIDNCGNTGRASQTIYFTRDSEAPVITISDPNPLPRNPTIVEIRNAFGIATATDNCSTQLTATYTDADEVNVSGCIFSVTRTWYVADDCGNTNTASQAVYFTRDTDPPVLQAQAELQFCPASNNIYTIPSPLVSDNCGVGSISYSVSGATVRSGSGNNASGLFNRGTSIITWTATDVNGNSASLQTRVVVARALEVTIPDAYVLPRGVSPNTIYFDYGPTYLNIKAEPKYGFAPYTYNWSNGETLQTISAGSAIGSTIYEVTVTDALGCVATATKTIQGVNVRCGLNLDKVSVCKYELGRLTNICIDSAQVAYYLNNQSYLGICADNITNIINSVPGNEIVNKLQVAVMPNPTPSYFNIKLESLDTQPISIKIMNTLGARIEEANNLLPGTLLQLGHQYPSGLYFLEVRQGNEKVVFKMIKAKG
jgi:hypothetical protein